MKNSKLNAVISSILSLGVICSGFVFATEGEEKPPRKPVRRYCKASRDRGFSSVYIIDSRPQKASESGAGRITRAEKRANDSLLNITDMIQKMATDNRDRFSSMLFFEMVCRTKLAGSLIMDKIGKECGEILEQFRQGKLGEIRGRDELPCSAEELIAYCVLDKEEMARRFYKWFEVIGKYKLEKEHDLLVRLMDITQKSLAECNKFKFTKDGIKPRD